MEANSLHITPALFSERDVTIDRLKLQIGTAAWPLERLGKLEKQLPSFSLPPRNFLIGGAIALLFALVAGGFLGFLFLAAGIGANVWWFYTQRPYSLVMHSDAGARIIGKWTGDEGNYFVNRVLEKVEDAKLRAEVRRRILSEKRPFAKFGRATEQQLETLQALDPFGESDEVAALATAIVDFICDGSGLNNQMTHEASVCVYELLAIRTEKARDELSGRIANSGGDGDSGVEKSIEAQRIYEQGLILLKSDDNDTKVEGVKLVHHATELNPNFVDALVTLGRVYFVLGKNDPDTRIRLNNECLPQGFLGISIDFCKRAVQADPGNPNARNLLGSALFYDGRRHMDAGSWNEAFEAFRETLIIQPNSLTALALLEHVGDEAGRRDDVQEVLIGLSAKAPPFDAKRNLSPQAEELLESAKEQFRNGDWDNAFDTGIKSLDAEASVDAWLLLVVAANKSGRSDEIQSIKMRILSKTVVDD